MTTQAPDAVHHATENCPDDSSSVPMSWEKPHYERQPLSGALSGGVTNNDGAYTFSS